MRPRLCAVVLLSVTAALATPSLQTPSTRSFSESATDSPSAATIIERIVERATRQDESAVELEFESLIRTTVDSFDADGNVTKTDTTLHKRYALEGELYEELVQRNGAPLTDDESEKERERRDEFVSEARELARRGEELETNDERQVRLDQSLIDRFQGTVAGIEAVEGEPAWVVSFEPRPGKLPERTRIEKALNRSTGRLYVAQRDYGVMRVEFELQEPIRYLWGLIATLRRAEGRAGFRARRAGRVAPRHFRPGNRSEGLLPDPKPAGRTEVGQSDPHVGLSRLSIACSSCPRHSTSGT